MKILLVANYLPDAQRSMFQLVNMLKYCLEKDSFETRIVRPHKIIGRIKPHNKGLGKWLGYVDKYVFFLPTLKNGIKWADVVHICDQGNSMYTRYCINKKCVVTCHDLLAVRSALGEFKENTIKSTGKVFQKIILKGLNNADHVACVSRGTQKDLFRLSNLKQEQVSIVYSGLSYPYSPMEKEEAKKRLEDEGIYVNQPFLLHVGKNNWYKNKKGLLEIFAHFMRHKNTKDFKLVLVSPQRITKEMKDIIEKNSLKDMIIDIQNPSNEDLRALYSLAKGLIYPSIAEGFGWPIIEAQACGCPVFTTNKEPMTEAGGEAAVYFDPYNVSEAASIILETLSNQKKIEKMKEKGFENIKRFSHEKMTEEYTKIYKKLIMSKKRK